MGADAKRLEEYPDLLTDQDLAEIYRISTKTIRRKRLAGVWGPRHLPNLGEARTPKAEVVRDITGVGSDLIRRLKMVRHTGRPGRPRLPKAG